jgi:hypothetical protein
MSAKPSSTSSFSVCLLVDEPRFEQVLHHTKTYCIIKGTVYVPLGPGGCISSPSRMREVWFTRVQHKRVSMLSRQDVSNAGYEYFDDMCVQLEQVLHVEDFDDKVTVIHFTLMTSSSPS